MGNENERKRDPAENREKAMGHQWDSVKTGGEERNVGLTGDAGFGPGGAGISGSGVGTTGIIGGSAEFLGSDPGRQRGETSPDADDQDIGSEARQVLTGDQSGEDNFSGQPQSGTSAIAANNSRADLGASGAGSPGGKSDEAEEPSDYLQKSGNPQAGFAERGRGAPEGSRPGGIEGTGSDRTANRDTDIEGSSTR